MNKKNIFNSAILVLLSSCVWSQENFKTTSNELSEVVISDSKFALEKEKSGKIITIISADELARNVGQSLANVLSTVAGVEINGNQSVTGKNLGSYIRGGKNNQVLIIIDGIPVTDASGINLEYDLRLLPIEQIESIEIMKGAASTLYGSGAATGVINIILKKAGIKKMDVAAYINLGTNNTSQTHKISAQEMNQGVSFSGTASKIHYLAALNSTEVNGMSQIATPNSGTNTENDRFSRINLVSKLGFNFSKQLSIEFFGNLDRIHNAYDAAFDNTGTNDTPFNQSKSDQVRFGFVPKYHYKKGEFNLNVGFTKLIRAYQELSYLGTLEQTEYASRSINADAFNKYNFSKLFFIVTGFQFQFHDMNLNSVYGNLTKASTKFVMADPYATAVISLPFGLNVNLGSRYNTHSQYGNQLVYNINPSFDFKSFPFKVLTSVSTAFITPSLYQLYSEYGNSNLTPEKNTTFEVGFETQLLDKKIRLSSIGFYREQTNFIGFYTNPVTFQGNYINIDGKNTAKGIETEFSVAISKSFHLNTNYTFILVEEALDRLIPKHKMNASLVTQLTKKVSINTTYQYMDGRKDFYFDGITYTTQKVSLASYQLVNTTFRIENPTNKISYFASLNNIFNVDFVENIGYSTRGRNFKIGIILHL